MNLENSKTSRGRFSRHAPVSILMLCLLLLGIGIHQKTNRAIAPPIYDAMHYYTKGARVWTEWGMGRLVNPFNVGSTVRPPGTMLLSSPLGFSRNFRAFLFRSIYYPIVLFVVGFWLLAESRAYQPGQSWTNLTGALMLASLPMFYQFERNPAFTSPYDWGYVDCFVAALAALATGLLLVSVRRCSIRLATVGSLAGALTLLVKPVSLLLMPLFYFFWITELLIIHGPIFARWREDKLLRNYSIWSATLLAVLFFLTAVVCFKSDYLSQQNITMQNNALKILRDMFENAPLWSLVASQVHTSFGWHWFYMSVAATLLSLGSIAFRVLRRHGRREDFRFLVVLATLCLGIVWWIRFAGPQIRYVYPFVLTFLVVALPDILGKAAVHLPKWSRRTLAALCMAPLAVVIALLFAETPSIQWQHILGVNLSSGHFREEVEMGNLLVQEAQSQARNLNIYVLGADERPGVVEAQGIYRNLLKPEAPTLQLQRPIDWIRPIMVRRKEFVPSDFLLFYPVRDSNRLRALLARQVVNDPTTEMDVFSAWLTQASEDQGLRVVSESVLRLVKVVDHVKLDQAFGKLMAQHRWQDLFYAENNEPCF